jgi:DNA-binding Lrp family transcriptional regulator
VAERNELLMTQADRDRLVALKKARDGQITQRQAAEQLQVSERHVRRMLKQLELRGDRAIIHKLRGCKSNRRIDESVRARAIEILQQEVYRGFGPTLASEYLAKRHQLQVSKETVRKWMIAAGLWSARKQRISRTHFWRARRERYGELVQWDTSEHDWLEGRGDKLYLVKMIDDATSRLFARFVKSDSTAANMAVLEQYLHRFGRPLEFYTDKASHFVSTPKAGRDPEAAPLAATQIQRALQELRIGWIGAHSPQAKGRVERSFETAQDRLVKGMRVAGVHTLDQANAYLEAEYLPEWNAKFSVLPACCDDAHRQLSAEHDLDSILSHVEERVITNDYTIRFGGKILQIEREHVQPRMRRQTVRVEARRDGMIAVRFDSQYVSVAERQPAAKAAPRPRNPPLSGTGKAHNAGGKSQWMNGFFQQPAPTLRTAIGISNRTS